MDLQQMIPKIVKLLAHPDLVAKKVVYCILSEYSSKKPDVALLAINTLTQECTDGNPMVRGLALKTVCSLNHDNFLEFAEVQVQKCLGDQSAYVRRIAVNCCGRLHAQKAGICQELGLVNKLYNMLRDPDPIVVVNSLVTLNEILQYEGGVVVNQKMAMYLLNRFETFTVWGQIHILQIMNKYTPKKESEVFDIMNLLDTYLSSNSASLVTLCLKYFCHLVRNLPHLMTEVIARGLQGICNVMNCDNHEIVFCMLSIVEEYIHLNANDVISKHYKLFFCKMSEPNYLKEKKMELLHHLVTSENLKEILTELILYAKDESKSVSLSAIMSFGSVLQKQENVPEYFVENFGKLLSFDKPYVYSNTLTMMQQFSFGDSLDMTEILKLAAKGLHKLVDDGGKVAFLDMIGHHGDIIPDSPYILEDFVEQYGESCSDNLMLNILKCSMKLFFHHPAIGQTIMGDIFEQCLERESFLIQDQVNFFYNILQTDVSFAKSILLT